MARANRIEHTGCPDNTKIQRKEFSVGSALSGTCDNLAVRADDAQQLKIRCFPDSNKANRFDKKLARD